MTPPEMTPPGTLPETPPVFIDYQRQLLSTTADPVVLYEKSRRIGASWTSAYAAVEAAALSKSGGGMDVMYIGYNLEMAREFIDDCAFWSRHLSDFVKAVSVEDYVFTESDESGDRSIKAFRIAFDSGYEIVALSSRPRSLRGRQGFVIIDEAAFHDDLAGLIKAALALLMWGGKVWIISTHDGEDNPFNEMVEDVRAGRKPYKLLRTTFQDALDQGLYKRICLVTGKDWSPEAEAAWARTIYDYYGDDAAEELDVIPSKGSAVWLTRAVIDSCMNPHGRVVYLACPDGFELKPTHERQAYVAAWLEDEVDPLLAALDKNCLSFMGGDFARTADLSVFMPGQLAGNTTLLVVPFFVELRNVPFREQEQILFHLCDRLPRFTAGAFDARGLGAALSEFAMQRYGDHRIEQVKATVEWYRENMPPLKARFEDRTIDMPLDSDARQDLRMIKVNKGVPQLPEGMRARSSRGGYRHGDAAIAAALLNFASTMDVIEYEYEPASLNNPRLDDGRSENFFNRHRNDDRRGAMGRMKGAW